MSQPFSTFDGTTLYLDTMIFFALVRNIDLDVVKPLFRRIKDGEWQAFTSALTFDELSYHLLLALIGEQHEGNPLNHLRSNEEQMIATYYPRVANEVGRLQTFPGLIVLDVTVADLATMHQLVLQHRLRPRDALHLTAMHKVGCLDLVSNDGDFDRVPDIQRFTLS